MKKYFIHNIFFRLIAPIVYGLLAYLLILLINNNVSQVNDLFNSREVYICIALTYISFESIRVIILALDRYLILNSSQIQIPLQFLSTTIVSVSLVFTGLSFYFHYVEGFSIGRSQVLIFCTIYTVASLLYNILYISNHYLQKENSMKLAAEKQHHDVLEMEMIEFRNDINPDLLFESLESLISLIHRDVEQAEEYIDCLASAYRYVLSNRQQELVQAAVEVAAAQNFITLLNQKHFGLLSFESTLEEDDANALLIPGSLSVIIESLVRSTIISRYVPLVIRCYLEDDYITIQTTLNDRLLPSITAEVALKRLQKSYSLYSDRPLIKVKAYEENYIKLPVIHAETEINDLE